MMILFTALVALMLILTGIGAIAALLLLAAFFTRRMNRVVMEPVGELVAAAERVRQGIWRRRSLIREKQSLNMCVRLLTPCRIPF